MHTTSTPAAAMRSTEFTTVRLDAGARHLILFFVAAYLLAWLPFGVAILAARGAFPLPVPEAVFVALATLGIGAAGVGAAVLESGRAGLRDLRAQVVRWRVRPSWY